MTRLRAADDFGTIRARMEELRRERTQALTGAGSQTRRGQPSYPGWGEPLPRRTQPRGAEGSISPKERIVE